MITWKPGMKLYQLERRIYKEAYRIVGGDKKKLAKKLGVSESTAYRRCKKYRLMGAKR